MEKPALKGKLLLRMQKKAYEKTHCREKKGRAGEPEKEGVGSQEKTQRRQGGEKSKKSG